MVVQSNQREREAYLRMTIPSNLFWDRSSTEIQVLHIYSICK
jgi:hypothetical protein